MHMTVVNVWSKAELRVRAINVPNCCENVEILESRPRILVIEIVF